MKKPLRRPSSVKEVTKTTPTKKTLKRKVEPAPTSGPQPIIPKGHKWRGKLDPMSQGDEVKRFYRIQPDDMPGTYPKLHKSVPPNTVWRVNTLIGVTNALVTVMPDGVSVAWASCSACLNHVDRCICKTGILHSRGVEHIYMLAALSNEGIHKDHPINSTDPDLIKHARYHYTSKETGRVLGSTQDRAKPSTRPNTARPAEQPSQPQKKTLRKGPQVDVSNVDLGKLNKEASSSAKDAEATLSKAMGITKKPLKKSLRKV